ncbi:prephenate dehydrogenase [Gramella sp. KN1008]|uniref:prephenate dehydrogenase n=1 Tax=Gramella sp. KN1008 TaxID=2529298 RepID=UPI00103A1E54|nr:prephenate dehydrogenase [Gramella sp. KN1008]TBW30335.1 prephenate dehydrogenase [Gramella sp. KN1008]
MKVYIIGTGLIGGSFALDVKAEVKDVEIFGIDHNEKHLQEALEAGLIDHKAGFDDLVNADFVYLAIPVDASMEILPKILDVVNENCVVTDAGSTKEELCEKVAKHPKRRNYLAGHPIAGTEFSGPTAALHGLFKYKTNIICEIEKTAFKLQEKALEIFHAIGMRIRYMDPVSHDRHIAYVSHLSHISSFMLGKTVLEKEKNERDIFDLAGSGFASTVRLAKSSPEMWTPIFRQNKKNVIETLDEYISNLKHFRQLMEANDFEEVFQEMHKTNHIKDVLNGITQNENLKILENGK